ncbi:hypothetical protein BAZ12_03690 [Elizabethkingia miricola]|uniref:DUF5977 domain-containing protein n=1 Tax=Elizabethkingia miricola TaxID=172045 RepID=A0ABD4DQY2_ELIMR|nr:MULTISPECIES: DUF5977 domain-containing protein [Elizabethkingia]KUY19867.1 hypothetical protein ATB95_02740 [Elizabethkingia miricola]MCL1651513.1 DUF5977 domain-containing protein [Elizabethkingia miricola]OPC72907.1 hypothetical protein BAZ12_03690 [Elizabethkingia miricola]OPC73629.1 hypothetical protein BAZ13_00895 [Elizabethkingia miricola]QCO46107.1 hypothetical protein FCS00_06865 [Elizabethkingia sp. 2-6]
MKKIVKMTIFALISSSISAQSIQNYTKDFYPQSPNASPFAINGKYPVNMYKGVPIISIPLFSSNNRSSNLNISLNYNVKSVKPETIPTWTGLGWNLNIGGSITRIVNGSVDEIYQSNYSPYDRFSYLDHYSLLDNPNWNSETALANYASTISPFGNTFPSQAPNPDEFILNIGGVTGSFYMNEKGQWIGRTRDGKTFKIEHLYKNDYVLNENVVAGSQYGADKTHHLKRILYGFNILMDDGTKYIFGQDNNTIEFSSSNETLDLNFNPQIIPSSWNIKQIEYPDGKKTMFTYTREDRAVFLLNKQSNRSFYSQGFGGFFDISNSEQGGAFNRTSMNRTHNVFLTKIEGEDFIIHLNKSISSQREYESLDYSFDSWELVYDEIHHWNNVYSNNQHWYKLDNISITDKAGKSIKNIIFNYNNDPNNRLLLNSMIVNDIEKYSFSYNPQKLPTYLSDATDHWGYYNGSNFFGENTFYNKTPDQLKNLFTNTYPLYKAPNLTLSKAETLEQITFPTGGKTYFEYELNDYSKYGDKDMSQASLKLNNTSTGKEIAGGLRIKNIKSCDENIKCISKTYKYLNDDGSSSGILPYKPLYLIEGSDSNINLNFWEFNSHSYQSLKDEDNSIGYSKVTETDDNGGKTETYFTNFDQTENIDIMGTMYYGWINLGLYKQLPFTSFSLMRGKPLKEIVYSDNKKISETSYIYNQKKDYIKAYSSLTKQFGTYNPDGAPFHQYNGISFATLVDAHYVNFNTSFLKQKITTQDNVSTINSYEYDNVYNLQPTLEKTTHASGDIIETKYQYPHEKSNQYMIEKNMIGIPLQTTKTKIEGSVSKTISNTEAKYPVSQAEANIVTSGFPLPKSIQNLDLQNPTISQTEITYDLYDTKGNILQYSEKGTKPTVIIWGYNQTQPIAKIEGAIYNQVSAYVSAIITASDADNTQGTDQSEQALIGALDLFRNNPALSGYQITTYTYNPLIGVTSITPPSGVREVYKYDSANRLESVKDINGNLLKEYQYKYKSKNENENTSYYNIIKSQTFTKNNCTPGTIPGTYTYTVPANKYTSTVSQADADQKAQNDINANGQEQTNLFATCTPPTSCTFNPVTTGIAATFTPSGSSIVYYNLNFNSSTKPYFNFDSKQNVLIGKIDLGCAPTSTFQIGKSEGGRYWMITIEPSGNFYLQLLNGSVNSGSFSISDSYSKNGSIN